jgi:hypothetical protein
MDENGVNGEKQAPENECRDVINNSACTRIQHKTF